MFPSYQTHKRNSTLTTSKEFYEDHLYSTNSSVSCVDDGSDHCSLYYCVNENFRCTKKFPTCDVIYCSKRKNLSSLSCFCVTYNEGEDIIEVGNCIYNCDMSDLSNSVYHVLPKNVSKLNEVMCGKFNGNGTLCVK